MTPSTAFAPLDHHLLAGYTTEMVRNTRHTWMCITTASLAIRFDDAVGQWRRRQR